MKQEGNVSRSLTWRVLSVLVAILLTVSGVSSATASGKIAPDSQEGSPPPSQADVFQVEINTSNYALSDVIATGSVLLNQFNMYSSTAAISQNFETRYDSYDSEVADDFVVPVNDGVWSLDSIEVMGACDKNNAAFDCVSLNSANVRIYKGAGILPGDLVYSADSLPVISGELIGLGVPPVTRVYKIAFNAPVSLTAGTYWVSVQVNMNSYEGNWGWLERGVQNGNWHVFRNPGGGWQEGCLTWCSGHPNSPDLVFSLYGNLGGTYKTLISTGNFYDDAYDVAEHGTEPLIYISVPNSGEVLVFNTQTETIQDTIPLSYPKALAISPDNSKLYVATNNGIMIIDTATNTVIGTLAAGGNGKMYFDNAGFLYTSYMWVIQRIDIATNTVVNFPINPIVGENLAMSPDGKTLCSTDKAVNMPKSMACYDISAITPSDPWVTTNLSCLYGLYQMDISGDNQSVFVNCFGPVKIYDLKTLAEKGEINNNGAQYLTFYDTPDGKTAIGATDSETWLLDGSTFQPQRPLDHTQVTLLKTGVDNHTVYATTYNPKSLVIYKFFEFQDIPWKHWARTWIERLYNAHITGGCGTSPLIYCPDASVTRAQMAVFLERGMNGSSFAPPAATGTTFGDVPNDHWAAAWIEQLAADGITGGCSGGNYCPETDVTRAQMAVFLLRAIHGADYVPPEPTGVFTDVPTNYWAAAWVEQLAAEGITSGCGGGNYCPDTPVTRAQMAVFLVKTFNLP